MNSAPTITDQTYFVRFLQNMKHYLEEDAKRTMLQDYQHWNIIYQTTENSSGKFAIEIGELKLWTQHIQMTGVLSLDASSQFFKMSVYSYIFPLLCAIILCVCRIDENYSYRI